jgi:2-haloacid dehalogenase
VCTAERARGYKPDGTLFRFLLAQAGVGVAGLLHCGQSQRTDMVGARPLGITVAWINRRGLTLGADVPKPDHEFRDLRPVIDLLDR